MRELKFRGKSESGDLYYGWVFKDFYGNWKIFQETSEWHTIIPDTVGQYTGFKDKNNNEIFEGDILQKYSVITDTEAAGIVEWSDDNFQGHWGWELVLPVTNNSFNPYYGFTDWEYTEIIGNIYDNPELLFETANIIKEIELKKAEKQNKEDEATSNFYKWNCQIIGKKQ